MRTWSERRVAIGLSVLSTLLLGVSGCPMPTDGTISVELSLEIIGEGSVTLAPPSSTYSQDDSPVSQTYDANVQVTLTAAAESGWSFYQWAGDLTGNDNPTTLSMSGDKDVIAIFMPEELVDVLSEIAPPTPDSEPLTPGTWKGYIAAEYTMQADATGDCRSDDDDSTFSYEHSESESRVAAVSVGPYSDIFVVSPREMDGQLVASVENTYHNVTRDDSEECCDDPPCANRVSPGDVFDFLTTQTGEATIIFDREIMGVSTEVLLNIAPEGMDEGDIGGLEYVLATQTWVRPYEDARIPVLITVEIVPADDKEVPLIEATDDTVTHACQGSTDNNTASSEIGTVNLSMSYSIDGVLIKRSNGYHEIIGMVETDWTEQSGLFPCGSHYPREYTDHCTVHLIRTP